MHLHAGIPMPCEATPASHPEVARALDPGAWFEAATRFGPVRLCAFFGAPVRHAADAALALYRCEGLLGGLHEWSAIDLAWRWVDAPVQRLSTASHACARWQAEAGAGTFDPLPQDLLCLLALPWALLRGVPAPPAALAADLHWPAVPVVLAVSQFRIDADELGQIEPGGAVVLPDSLLSPWHGVLRSADEPSTCGLGVPVALSTPWAPRLVRSAARTDAMAGSWHDERVACEVRLAAPRTLPGDRLTGWFDDEALAETGPCASLWRCASEHSPARCLAIGRLMPWGHGWALGLDTLCEATDAAAASA